MSEFKVGDRVITRWDYFAEQQYNITSGAIPDGEHTIIEIEDDACKLAGYPGKWYPIDNITKVDDAPEVKDDGGPAFPVEDISKCQCPGMSLRDYFAAKAMQGDWAAQDEEGGYYTHSISQEFLVRRAKLFFRMADAMLEARKK